MRGLLSLLTRCVTLSLAVILLLTSCLGQGTDQVHGMLDLKFSSTAVCNTQQRLIQFRNVSEDEIVIEGVAISGGTDVLGNFSLQSVVIGTTEQPSINGVLQDVHIPPGQRYAFKIAYLPKTENTTHEALLDIAYKAPREGVIQVALQGSSARRLEDCGGADEAQQGGPVSFDDELILTVELMIAATSAIQAPINTTQGKFPFEPVEIPIVLNGEEGTATLPPFTGDNFILPTPRDDVPGIGGIIKGSIQVTIPTGGSGTYDPNTGALSIPDLVIHMDGDLDFVADLTINLTTGRIPRSAISPPVNTQALQQFGSPPHWDPVAKEIFGTPINAETGKVFLVGMTKLQNVQLRPGSRSELSQLPTASMAVLIEGTIGEPEPAE